VASVFLSTHSSSDEYPVYNIYKPKGKRAGQDVASNFIYLFATLIFIIAPLQGGNRRLAGEPRDARDLQRRARVLRGFAGRMGAHQPAVRHPPGSGRSTTVV